jgi:hypothetical protein
VAAGSGWRRSKRGEESEGALGFVMGERVK